MFVKSCNFTKSRDGINKNVYLGSWHLFTKSWDSLNRASLNRDLGVCIYFNTDTTLLWLWCKTKKFRPKIFLGKEIALLRPIFNLSRCDGSVHRAFSVLVLKYDFFFGSQNTIIVTWKWSKCQTQKTTTHQEQTTFHSFSSLLEIKIIVSTGGPWLSLKLGQKKSYLLI